MLAGQAMPTIAVRLPSFATTRTMPFGEHGDRCAETADLLSLVGLRKVIAR